MLRVTDDTGPRPRRWPALAVAVLAATALGLHGTRPAAVAGPVVPAAFAAKADRPPLDASLVLPSDHPDAVGVFAVRVGELVRVPGMEKTAELYGNLIPSVTGDPKTVYFTLADIEQIAGRVTIKHEPKQPAPNRNLMLSLTMIRMAKDFDWVKQLRAWTAGWEEHAYGGSKMYSARITLPALGFKNEPIWFYLPDGRTAVLESEENIKKLIDARGKSVAPWADDWKAVAGGTFAVVLPDVAGKLAKKLPDEKLEGDLAESMRKPLITLCTKARRAAVGIDIGTGCSVTIRLACATAADAADVDAGCQAIAKLARAALADDAGEPTEALDLAGLRLSTTLVNGIEFGKTVDHVVEVRMKADSGMTDLLKALGATAK